MKNTQNTHKKSRFYFGARLAIAAVVASSIFYTSCSSNKKAVTPTAAASYSTYQQIFTLCMLSNLSGAFNKQSSATIHDSTIYYTDRILTDSTFQTYMGHWKCVWGPSVMLNDPKKNDSMAINSMFIAQNLDSPSLFVVAIAGTNFASGYDWLNEDFKVERFKYWDSVLANVYDTTTTTPGLRYPSAFISRPTFMGLFNLMSLHDTTLPGSPTAYQFLTNLVDTSHLSNINIWTTGHSLGGALAPTLALYLQNKMIGTNAKPKATTLSINCLAAAGATPGDMRFSALYKKYLQANTIRVWNRNDVVPHGFEGDMLQQVDTIYNFAGIPTPSLIQNTINATNLALFLYNYRQLYPATDTEFTSAIYTNANFINPADSTSILTPTMFLGQLVCQHVPAYPHYFGVDSIQVCIQHIMHATKPFFSGGFTPQPITAKVSIPAQ
ncbi:MAG: hypothetical protein P4L41_11775 [Flavipsychrobacter sp.]|nr:hypothetical protein [Flavipsychrobacter sp.]